MPGNLKRLMRGKQRDPAAAEIRIDDGLALLHLLAHLHQP